MEDGDNDREQALQARAQEALDCDKCAHNEASHHVDGHRCWMCGCERFVPKPLDLIYGESYKGDPTIIHLNNGDGYPACGSRSNSLNYDPTVRSEFPENGCMRCRKILVAQGRARLLTPSERRLNLAMRRL